MQSNLYKIAIFFHIPLDLLFLNPETVKVYVVMLPQGKPSLLDLLDEYMFTKHLNGYKKINTNDFQDTINYLLNPIKCVKDEQN